MPNQKRDVHELIVDELSLVDEGAVNDPFVFVKQKDGDPAANANPENADPSDGKTEEAEKTDSPESTTKTELPQHNALLQEMLNLISDCGKALWEMAPTLDLSVEENQDMLYEKMYQIREAIWRACDLAVVAQGVDKTKACFAEGHLSEGLEHLSKTLIKVAEHAMVNKEEGIEKSEHPLTQRSKVKMIDKDQAENMGESLLSLQKVLSNIPEGELVSFVQSLQKTEVELSDKEKSDLEQANDKIKALEQQLQKRSKKREKSGGSVQPPNGLNTEYSPTTKRQAEKVNWNGDLTADL